MPRTARSPVNGSRHATDADTLVVLLHGLWCNQRIMGPLARRLGQCGFRVARFDYPTVRRSPEQNAAALSRWLQGQQAERVHFVAHSLGGLILCHLLARFSHPPVGRTVLLGTPLRGSDSAARLVKLGLGQRLLGGSLEQGLLGDVPPWPAEAELGVIAGTVRLGFGILLGALTTRSDGAVAVRETQHPRVADHLQLRTSHTGLLFSPAVARQVCTFLETGHFQH